MKIAIQKRGTNSPAIRPLVSVRRLLIRQRKNILADFASKVELELRVPVSRLMP